MKLLITALAIVAVLIAGLGAAMNQPFSPANTIEVGADFGGNIMDYMQKYNEAAYDGKYLRIDGPCISACTYFDKLIPRSHVCAGPNALFGFHGVYTATGFDEAGTKFWETYIYLTSTLDLLRKRGFDGSADVDPKVNPLGIIWVHADELGIQPCPNR